MAVVIPRLESINPAGPQQSDRIQMNAPNLLGATAPLREGLGAAVDTVSDAYTKQQNELRKQALAAKDLKWTEKAIGYEQTLKSQLDSAKQMKGDPTAVYKSFDENMVKLESSLYDDETMDAEDRAILREKIIKANGRIVDTRSTNYTGQYYSWQKDVADSSVKLRQDNAVKDSAYLDIRNPVSFGKVQASLDEIQGTRTSIAIQNGYDIQQIKDEKTGVVTWDYSKAPMIEAQIKQDIGDAIIPMVKTLNAAGKVNEAKAIIKDQAKWLNADDLAKLTADNDEASVKNRALDALAKLGPSASIDSINAMKDIGEDVKLKMREINHTNSLHRERETDQKRNAVMSRMANEIDAINSTNTPFVSVEDFKERSKFWKNNKDMLSVQDRKTIEGLITTKKESDPEVFNDMWDAFKNQELGQLSAARILEIESGLSQTHKSMFRDMIKQAQAPTTESTRRSIMSSTVKRIDDAMVNLKFNDGTDMFRKKRDGKWDSSAADAANNVKVEMEKFIRETPQVTVQIENDKLNELLQIEAKKMQEQYEANPIRKVMEFFKGITGSTKVNPVNGGKEVQVISNPTVKPPPPENQPAQKQPKPTEPNKKTVDTTTGSNMNSWTTAEWLKDYAKRNSGKLPAGMSGSTISPQALEVLKDYRKKRLSGELK